MSKFNHILVPFDNSSSSNVAIKTALNLCKSFDARLTAVYVHSGKGDDRTDDVRAALDEIQNKASKDIHFMHPSGKMYKEVVRAADDIKADLIIMGTHGTSGFEEFWIGSNAYRVVSSASVPVITMQETFAKNTFDKIVVPIDQSKETRQKIPMVAQLSKLFNSTVHLLGTSKYTDEESKSKVNKYLSQSIDLLADADIVPTTSTIFGDNIAKTTLQYAESDGADLIIMMAESEPSTGLFMGTNAQQVVNRSTIPVMTLHAKDVGISIAGY